LGLNKMTEICAAIKQLLGHKNTTNSVISVIGKKNGITPKWCSIGPDWAAIYGFDSVNVSWQPKKGQFSRDEWDLLSTTPIVDKVYTLSVDYPFTATSDRPFWVLYEPLQIAVESWRSYPEEIPFCCLVQVHLLEIIKQNRRKYTYINVRVDRVIPLDEIIRILPPNDRGDILPIEREQITDDEERILGEASCARNKRITKFGVWTLVELFGTHINYWVITQNHEEQQIAILYGQWSHDDYSDYFYAGHRPLTQEEWLQLIS
jgi:hypothetical protein